MKNILRKEITVKKRFIIVTMTVLASSLFCLGAADKDEAMGKEELISALTELNSIAGKEEQPAVEETEKLKKVVDQLKEDFGSGPEVVKAALELVKTYDEVQGPLFVARGEWDKGHRRKRTPPANDIHWTVYHVMQYIFDYVYTPENIVRYKDLLEGYSFGSHKHFPGPAGPPEDPEEIYETRVSTWSPVHITFEEHVLSGPRRPTGAYVAPGTVVTVGVPESLVGKGYKIRVGAHSWDNTRKRRVTRLARVSYAFDIVQATNTLMHPLGGGIYIEVPKGSDDGIVTLSIKGAVRSPYFSATSFQKTTNEEWLEVERRRKAPWADFHTDKFMMQVPTMWVTNLMDPEKLMADWDLACDAQNELFGQPLIKARQTHYLQVDLQNRGRAFFPGYPTCNDRYDPDKETNYMGYANNYLVRGPAEAPSHVFHEQGHAFRIPKYPGERESVVNLPHVAVLNRKFGVDLIEAFSGSRSHKGDVRHTLDNTAITWMCIDSFAAETEMKNYEKQYQWKGHAKYVDIARLFGWEVLDRYWAAFNDEVARGTYKGKHAYSNDEITIRKSRAAGVDLRPLVRFWGIVEDDFDALEKQIKDNQLPASAKIYDTLVHYKSLVPKDNKAFREHAMLWWKKKPSAEGYTTERNHAAYWDSYDEETAKKLRGIVQKFIDRYFPDGRPDTGK